eukprot:symbB.v1.2.002735.t1/scaffold146.1/size298692/16
MQGTKVLCRERGIDPSLVCSQCVKVFTGGAYEDAGIAVPAHPEMPDVVQCLSLSVGEVEGTGANATQGQAIARNRSPLKQTAFCNYETGKDPQGFLISCVHTLPDFSLTPWWAEKMRGEGSYVLLKAFQQLCAPSGMKVTSGWQPSLNIRDFEHGGTTMSGLVSDVDIRAGKEILGFPTHTRVTDEQLHEDRFNGCNTDIDSLKTSCGYAKHAMWLAEKKLQVLGTDADNAKGWLPSWIRHRLVETGDAEKDYWSAWIHSLPKYEDYEGLGLPLTAPATELRKLQGLPKFGDVPAWTQDLQDSFGTGSHQCHC